MDLIGRGIIAGFAATLVLSALIEPLAVLGRLAGIASFGWLLHLLLGGSIWGAGFALVHDALPGPSWWRGVVFAAASSLVVTVLAAVLGAGGLLDIGPLSATVLLHALYGAALGGIYGVLMPERDRTTDLGDLGPALR